MEGAQGPERNPQPAAAPPINLSRSLNPEPKEGVLMKRTMNRLLARLAMFVVAIILGAIAVAQAHRGLENRRQGGAAAENQVASEPMQMPPQTVAQPIPITADPPAPASTYSDEYAESAYGQPDPGFDNEPVSYQDTETYREALEQPAPVSESYGAADPTPAYGEPSGYGDPPAAYDREPMPYPESPSAPVQVTAAESTEGDYRYGYETPEPATPPDAYDPDAYEASPYAQPAQFTESTPAEPPMTLSTQEPAYTPADTAGPSHPDADPGYADSGYGDSGYGDTSRENTRYDGSASIAIGDMRTRQPTPAYDPPASPNPGYADPALAGASSMQGMTTRQGFSDASRSFSGDGVVPTGNGKPGPRELEGTQSPSLTVSKSSPPEVQVGKPATFTVTVNNVGGVAAHDVLIRDQVPHGTRLLDTSPPASQTADGALLWEMGTIEAGSQVSVTMEVMPVEEGEIGSVATVSFQASASSKSISTRPELVLEHTAERQVLVGNDVLFRIQLTNTGSGAATNVTLEEDVPSGLRHYDGRELEFQIGTLQPQESRILELKLKADQPGPVTNMLVVRADGDLVVSDQYELEVVAPGLQVAIDGPRRRYLERRATHEIAIANPGTAAAKNVSLVARLPRALKFVNTNNAGQYDNSAHAVRWNLDELPAKEMGKVELTTVPTEMGEHRIQVTTRADMGLEDAADHEMMVDGLAALLFTVTDVSDPIEVGGETTYEVHVVNQGSKTATNLRLMAAIPSGMQAINGEGPTRAVVDGQRVLFDPLARLAPQSDSFYKIHVKGTLPGDQRIKVLMTSDEVREPVTKEESTHVYADE